MGKQGVFLDRDGVINRSYGKKPPNRADEVVLFDGVGKAVRDLNAAGYQVFIVTNQGGVGLGYMTGDDLDGIHERVKTEVGKDGGQFTDIAACTHKPWVGCACRKPNPGMILKLAREYTIDLPSSYMIGDRDVDIQAGQAANTKTVFIGSVAEAPADVHLVADDLRQAVKKILAEN